MKNSSTVVWLSAVIRDVGHVPSLTPRRAHTGGPPSTFGAGSQPHLRFASRPDFRQTSHLHPAWLEN
jgi:hypothetical protein